MHGANGGMAQRAGNQHFIADCIAPRWRIPLQDFDREVDAKEPIEHSVDIRRPARADEAPIDEAQVGASHILWL